MKYEFSKDGTAGILRGLRATRRFSQEGLAKASGVKLSSIKGYENGENVMSLENAVKLSRALGVTPNDLINRVEEVA